MMSRGNNTFLALFNSALGLFDLYFFRTFVVSVSDTLPFKLEKMKIIKLLQIHKYAYQNLFCYLPKQNLSKRWTKESLVSDK